MCPVTRFRAYGCPAASRSRPSWHAAERLCDINKSQGMTMGKCLFDARCAPFQHGHAYVLFSRVRNRQSIAAVVDDATQRNGHLVLTILYDELLRDACEACDETP